MELLKPESGLLFWMTISFVIVFIVLAKLGFPIIIKAINSRKDFIDSSLDAAKEAEIKFLNLKSDSDALISAAQSERVMILKDASQIKDKIIVEAKDQARKEGNKIIEDAKIQATVEKEEILNDAKRQIALISIKIAEKILRENLNDETTQKNLAEKLIDEMDFENKF